jgi:microcystin-dependent protein
MTTTKKLESGMKPLRQLAPLMAGLALTAGASSSMACTNDGYLATLGVFAGNFAIRGCAFAQGQIMSINSNQSLFSLLGTTYGGDGRTSFALPDTRGRSVIGAGTGPGLSTIQLGQKSGVENRTLSVSNMPAHNHIASTAVTATATAHGNSNAGTTASPDTAVWAVKRRTKQYRTDTPNVVMSSDAVTVSATASTTTANTGSGTSFSVRDPYIGMHWLIQTLGIYPSRN